LVGPAFLRLSNRSMVSFLLRKHSLFTLIS
jgi:hypothetical protein